MASGLHLASGCVNVFFFFTIISTRGGNFIYCRNSHAQINIRTHLHTHARTHAVEEMENCKVNRRTFYFSPVSLAQAKGGRKGGKRSTWGKSRKKRGRRKRGRGRRTRSRKGRGGGRGRNRNRGTRREHQDQGHWVEIPHGKIFFIYFYIVEKHESAR